MNEKKYIVNCPVCGKTLFKSAAEIGCAIDMQCAKCGSYLNIKHEDQELRVKETTQEYKV